MNVRVGEVASTGNTSATQVTVTDKRPDIIGQAITHFIGELYVQQTGAGDTFLVH